MCECVSLCVSVHMSLLIHHYNVVPKAYLSDLPGHGSGLGQVVHLSRVQKVLELPINPGENKKSQQESRIKTKKRKGNQTLTNSSKAKEHGRKNISLQSSGQIQIAGCSGPPSHAGVLVGRFVILAQTQTNIQS